MNKRVAEEASTQEHRYQLLEPLGEGGVGAVFRAWDSHLGREVAIKRLKPSDTMEEDALREARILAVLNHPNVVSIHDFGIDPEGPFVVMELIDGRTLDSLTADGPLDIPTFAEIAAQICRGLAAAHARGVVHGDLKPSNVMLQYHEDGGFTVKLLDFGLARSDLYPDSGDNDETSVLGTVHTIAPEQLRRETADARTDIYSLGCIFYHALAGRYPFLGETTQQIIQGHLHQFPTPLSQCRTDVSPALSHLVLRMLARDPAQRPPSADHVRSELHALFQTGPPSAPFLTPPPAPRSSGALAAIVAALAALLLIAGLAYLAVAAFRDSRPAAPAPGAPPPAEAPPLDPSNLDALRARLGAIATVEGAIAAYGQSHSATTRYLNFAHDYRDALSLVFRIEGDNPAWSEANLRRYVGKRVRVTGEISEYKGNIQIVMRPGQEIAILP